MLHYDIKSVNMEITGDVREFTNEKISALEKFVSSVDHPIHGWVELEKTGEQGEETGNYRAEVQFFVPGKTIRAEAKSSDVYSAITDVRDKVERELKEYKEKYTDVSRRRARKLKEHVRDFFRGT